MQIIENHTKDVPIQPSSEVIWDERYALKTITGERVDPDIPGMFDRVAAALAGAEDDTEYWREQFRWAMENGATPAGRILSNAGAGEHKPATTLINCTVSRTIRDSMRDILEANTAAGMTLKAGAGIGYCFSTLRPRGAIVAGAGASTNGPLAFMDIFDRTCETVSSAGGRRGAQMATIDVAHPDVEAFVTAKQEDGRFRKFNLSVLITDAFMEAVKEDREWPLLFPLLPSEQNHVPPEQILFREWEVHEPGYTVREDGLVACRVYQTIRARDLWNTIMRANYDHAEPGFILIDHVNRMNNNWFDEDIRATNP